MGEPPFFDQYAFVGPALFEMDNFPDEVRLVVEARSGAVHQPEEVWCPINRTWLRLDGEWVSGWRGAVHFGFRPHLWNRLKIRLAANRWQKKQGAHLLASQTSGEGRSLSTDGGGGEG